jgi:hypothetical protein
MFRLENVERLAWVKGERKALSPVVRVILGIIFSGLALSPAILGIYWELVLP